jgi:hypothetical protein
MSGTFGIEVASVEHFASLVWMPPGGQPPPVAAFELGNRQFTPESWRHLWEAIEAAGDAIVAGRNYGKEPWIMVRDSLLRPTRVRELYKTLQI